MKTELLLAFLTNIKVLFTIAATVSGFSGAMCLLARFIEEDKKFTPIALKFIGAAFFLGIFACIPNADELWKVRIAMIKLELASPENIKDGVQVIEEIGKKLECKYLGCDEKKTPASTRESK